jgi:hypothetical protein
MTSSFRPFHAILTLSLLIAPPTFSFDTPLSDTAVRQAYFMGQRHDESLARFLDHYTKHLAPPKTGPYISAVSFLTPYALLTQLSDRHAYGYSAQQAELNHRSLVETVKIVIEIQLTDTYSNVMHNPAARTTGTPTDYLLRPSDFWRDFQVQIFNGDDSLVPFLYSGHPVYFCGDTGCTLVGATIQLEFLAESFSSDSARVSIDPPEGDSVSVDFDLGSLR